MIKLLTQTPLWLAIGALLAITKFYPWTWQFWVWLIVLECAVFLRDYGIKKE